MRDSLFLALAIAILACPAIVMAGDPEIRDFDVSGWSCLDQPAGTAKTQDGMDRNPMKNRPPISLSGTKIESLDTAGFLKKVGQYDKQIDSQRRNQCTAAQKQLLNGYENQLVSLTGFLVLAYPGPPESTNCGDRIFHDWHLELFENSSDHHPQIGDPTPIICEIAPRTERNIYRDGIRLQSLAGYFRRSKEYIPTGHPPRLIRVTGYLTWDDEHNGTADIGPTVQNISAGNGFHHPWRSTAWEIHPIIKIEPLDGNVVSPRIEKPPQQPVTQSPATPMPKVALPSPTPVAEFATIVVPTKIKIPYGETILPVGMKLPVVSRDAQTVRVKYMGTVYVIPMSNVR
jgi:hypothetical protein